MLPLVTAPGLCPGSNGALTSPLPPGIVFRGIEKRADICCLALWPNLTSCELGVWEENTLPPRILLLGTEGRGQAKGCSSLEGSRSCLAGDVFCKSGLSGGGRSQLQIGNNPICMLTSMKQLWS